MNDEWWTVRADPDEGDGRGSLGERIDRALGEFERTLGSLKDQLQERRAQVERIESEIAAVEKQQARAFKDLVSGNSQIRKLLNPRGKGRSQAPRRRGNSKAESSAPEADADRRPPSEPPRKPRNGGATPGPGTG